MSWKFIAFLMITLIRQVPQFVLMYKFRNEERKVEKGRTSAVLMYSIYILIWLISLASTYYGTGNNILFVIGFSILVLGIALRFLAISTLGGSYSGKIIISKNQKLVTSGLYRFVRHPLHLALLIELLGMIILSEIWWLLFFWSILLLIVIVRNKKEDALLSQFFGEEHKRYKERVPSMNIIAGILKY